jgi:hypothetical protein
MRNAETKKRQNEKSIGSAQQSDFFVPTFFRFDVSIALASLLFAQLVRADTVTFTGTGIALRGCKIQAVQGGQVSYTDPNGQRQRRPLEQIEALGFDGLPQLDQAETALADQNLDAGLWALLRALLSAESDVQRIWIRARLSQAHDSRGEYVQAAGHAAEVFTLSDDVSWKSLRPVSPINTPSYVAANEALESLQNAARRVKSAELQREIETMTRLVQGVHAKLAAGYTGPAIERGSTVSGFIRADVLANEQQPKPGSTPIAATPAAPAVIPSIAPSVPAEDSNDPRSAAAIDRLLAAGRAADVVSLCADIEKSPGERDLARFLYQYGKALSQADRKGEAAVMLTRCAILYPDSDDAGPALIETAIIYRDAYRKPDIGRRLLERVIADAQSRAGDDAQSAAANLARELLNTWPPT